MGDTQQTHVCVWWQLWWTSPAAPSCWKQVERHESTHASCLYTLVASGSEEQFFWHACVRTRQHADVAHRFMTTVDLKRHPWRKWSMLQGADCLNIPNQTQLTSVNCWHFSKLVGTPMLSHACSEQQQSDLVLCSQHEYSIWQEQWKVLMMCCRSAGANCL